MLIQREDLVFKLTFVFVALMVAAYAIVFGVLEPDSRSYLELAESLQNGAGCSISGQYNAVEACGYPVLIAGLNMATGIGDLVTVSKLVNLILLLSSYVLLLKSIKNIPTATLFFVNPIVFYTYTYTMSEIMLLFAFCGAMYCLHRLRNSTSTAWDVVYLTAFLVMGCFSRYFFGPFCCVMWLSAYATFGRRVAWRALPAFVVACIVYLLYQRFNLTHTGYSTGMERMPAPETVGYLTTAFIVRVFGAYLAFLFTVCLYRVLAQRNWKIITPGELLKNVKEKSKDTAAYKFLLLAGAGYLLLMLLIRMRFCFDLFDYRIIGFGVVFSGIALIGLGNKADNCGGWKAQSAALVVCGIFAVVPTQSLATWKSALKGNIQRPKDLIARTHTSVHNKTIFSLGTQNPSDFIAGGNDYYDGTSRVIYIIAGPAERADNLGSLKAKVSEFANDDCVFDFTNFANQEDFETEVIKKAYPVALDFSKSVVRPGRVLAPAYDPDVANLLLKIYKPKSVVPCVDVLQQL